MFRLKLSSILVYTLLSALFSPAFGEDCSKARQYFEQAKGMGSDTLSLIKAEQLYRKAIELCPSYTEAHNNLGDVYEKQGRFEEAIAKYKKTITLRPDAPYPYFGLGDIYAKTNRPKEAVEWYKKGLKYDPNDRVARQRLSLAEDMQKGGVIKAEMIRGMLSTTRGAGEIVSITFGERLIPFDFDKYDIRSDAKSQLDEIGKALGSVISGSDSATIEIAGHTDMIGTDEYNLDLSDKRARSVVNYLSNNFNIPKERLLPKGYGERVNLCTSGVSETIDTPCNALNRRVEIVKKTGGTVTRGVGGTEEIRVTDEPKIAMEAGFFYQKSGEKMVNILNEDKRLRSRSDRYFIFFRPLQDCYAYVIQEDSKGNVSLLFPEKGGDASVKASKDYWVPGFGKSYTLDDTKGHERIYLVTTSQSIESKMEWLSLKEQVRGAISSLQTRIIKVVRPSGAVEAVSSDELYKTPQKINAIIERVEGEGGWVRVVRFGHE